VRQSKLAIVITTLLLLVAAGAIAVPMHTPPAEAKTPPDPEHGVAKPDALVLYLPSAVGQEVQLGGYAYGEVTHIDSPYQTEYYAIDLNPVDQRENIYPAAPGNVVYSGDWNGWGNTVVVQHNVGDGYDYYSQYSHLSSIVTYGSFDHPQTVSLYAVLGIEGDTGCSGAPYYCTPHLHFVLRRCTKDSVVWNSEGVPTGLNDSTKCQSVVPEPFVGSHVNEGLAWWNQLEPQERTSMKVWKPITYGSDTTAPGGSWGSTAIPSGTSVRLGQNVVFDINYSDVGSGVGEVRLTAYYPDWPSPTDLALLKPALDPQQVWRIVARCDPRLPDADCKSEHWVFTWNPYFDFGLPRTGFGLLPVPWLPKAKPVVAGSPVEVCLSFDVFDTAGNPMYAPGGTQCGIAGLGIAGAADVMGNEARQITVLPMSDGATPADGADYVADVSVPDGSIVSPGQSLTKVWRVRNTGTTTWGSGYQLAFVGGHQLGAPSPISVPAAAPGQEANLSINIVAPTAAGEYMGYWRLRNPQGTYFGPTLSVRINVQSAGSHITALSVDPPSPADTSSVQIRVKIEGFPNLRATRLLIDGAVKYEIGGPEFAYTWLTDGYAAGDHSVVVEVADQTDTSWSHPERRAVTYRLTGTGAAPNHRPNAPTLTSPYDWYVYYSGKTAQLCAQANGDPDGDAITAYYFDIYDSAQTWNSGWVGGNCVTTAALGPYTYQWRVKVRDSRGAESDWSAPWHFTLVNPSLSITELYFQPQDADSEVVRIRACTAGLGGVGITMRVSVNDANDGSANGTWHIIKELGVPCFTEADAPLWRTLEFGTGTHRVRVEAHGADASWNGAAVREATYALPHRRPPSPPLVAPVPLSQNTRDSVYLNSRTVEFRWAPSLRATSYTLHVGTSPSPAGGASPLLRQTFSSGVTEATHTFSDDHPVLYWQVTAANDKGSNTSGDQQIGIDRTPPSCSVQPLPDVSYENVCQVVWGGTDSVSGIRSYAVQYLDSGRSDWVDWLTDVPAAKTYDLFVGQPGHTYSFRCRATDRANNVGTYPSAADTSIKVDPAARPTTPWWNTSYTGKRNITVQNNTTSSALPAGYPVNLRFDAGTSPTAAELYAASASPTKCDDLRIVASDTTQLHRVVKACSPTLIDIWFRTQVAVPAGGTNANSHQLYYGSTNPGALLADPNQVWYPYDEADTQYLFLFQEGSGATAYDSSGYGRHCSINPTVVWTTAKFGTGLRFNRANNGDSPSLTCGSAVLPSFTIEFWFRPDADGDGRIAGQIKQGVGPNWLLNLFEGKLRLDVWPCTTCGSSEVRSNANLRQAPYVGVWNHVAVSFNGGNEVRFYINGALDSVKVLNQTGLTQYDIPLEIGSVEGIGQLKDSLGAFRISSGVKTSFAYGPFGAITGEPSAVVGSVVNRPVSGTPDLQVLSLTAYPNPSGGILAEAVLRNAGTLSTQNGFFIDLYLNHTPTGPGDYTGSVQMWVNEPIAAGKTVTVTGVVSDVGGLAQAAAGATYSEVSGTLRVFADSSGAVAESSETNNLDPLGVEVCVASADSFEEDDTAATARALVLDEPQVHNFDGPGDGDWLRFTAQAGKAYVIETSNLGPATDTYLYLYGADGTTLLASNDDDGSTLASRIEWTAPADGTFYVLIKHWNPNVGGCGAGYTVGATLQRPAFRVLLPAVLRAYTPPRPTHTLRLTSLPGDGEIGNVECADWQTCRTASAGNFLLDEYPAATVAASAYSGLFDIKRVYLTFDASALPDNSDVVSATLSLHIGSWVNGNHGIVVVPSSHGSSLWPTDFGQPLETTTSEFLASSDQWVHIPLVGSDASWIGMDAYAGVILVHSYDFSGQQPTGLNDIVVSLSESDTFAPYLTIHYQDER